MALFVCMMAMAMPAWRSLNHSVIQQGSTRVLLATLEQARMSAIEKKEYTWFIFRHRSPELPDDFCIVQETADEQMSFLASWIALPKGILFITNTTSSLIEPPPNSVITALQKLSAPLGVKETLTALQFNPSGAITFPKTEDQQLQIELGIATSDNKTKTTILFSRLAGRPFIKK